MPAEVARDEGSGENIWSRRDLLSLAGWGAILTCFGAGSLAFVRFMYPRVLFEPPTAWKAGFPTEYAVNAVSSRWMNDYLCWIVRWPDGIFAISAICTHLGCTPLWLAGENKFKCPCHGSGYYRSGINFEGPTPRPLERAAISISPEDGQIFIDKARKFLYEKGQWTDPAASIKTT